MVGAMMSARLLFVMLLLASYSSGQDQGTGDGTAETSTDASLTESTTIATESTTIATDGTTEATTTLASSNAEGGGGGATSDVSGAGEEGGQPATCDPCLKTTASFKAKYKKNPKNIVQVWTSMCRAMGLAGRPLRACLYATNSKTGQERATHNLRSSSVTPQDICTPFGLCNDPGL